MNVIEVILRKDEILLRTSGEGKEIALNSEGSSLAGRIAELIAASQKQTTGIVFFVAEEMLFFTSFSLPLKTPKLAEAIRYQLEQFVPMPSGSFLYSYSSLRQEDGYKISLYAVLKDKVEKYLQDVSAAGYNILGLYPEGQRYIGKKHRKEKWSLVVPGGFPKVLVFEEDHLLDRLVCFSEPEFSELAAICGSMKIYHAGRPGNASFLDGEKLIAIKPGVREFNLLPSTFRRPDYYRKVLKLLLVFNLIGLILLFGVREYQIISHGNQLDAEIEKIMPLVKETKGLRAKEKEYNDYINRLEKLGKNPDLILFLRKITENLPVSSYIDQIRMDNSQAAIQIQGYTDDIGELTTKLQKIGDTKLKSTSRRQDKTYFQLEINLP